MKKLAIILGLVLAASSASAREQGTTKVLCYKNSTGGYDLISGVALNATAATRTLTMSLDKNWSKVRVFVQHTNSAATTVTATPTMSFDGTDFGSYTTRSCSGGTCTVAAMVDSNAVSGDEDFVLEYDVRGISTLKVLFAGASAGGSDLVDVQACAIAGE